MNKPILLLFDVAIVLLVEISCTKKPNEESVSFTATELQKYISNSHQQPVCVIFTEKTKEKDNFESKLRRIWFSSKTRESWYYGTFNLSKVLDSFIKPPAILPHFRCYLGQCSAHEYNGSISKVQLDRWLLELANKHVKHEINVMEEDIDTSCKIHLITILVFPDNQTHLTLEKLVCKICMNIEDCQIFIVHPVSNNFSVLQSKYKVNILPTILVFKQKDKYGESAVKYFTGHKINKRRIDTYILAVTIETNHFTKNLFKEKVLTIYKGRRYIPYIVGFYAYWSEDSRSFLSFLKTTVEEFQNKRINIRFGLVDLVEEKKIVERYIISQFAEKVPFIILFQQDNDEVNQTLIPADRPTSYTLHQACQKIGFNFLTQNGEQFIYQPYGKSDLTAVCLLTEDPVLGSSCSSIYHNLTDYQTFVCKNTNVLKTYKLKKRQTIHGMNQLTDDNIHNVIHTSDYTSNILLPTTDYISTVYMIVFIIADCSSCNRHIQTFQNLKKQVNTIAGSSFYIINCTRDFNICNRYNITGYPTVTIFRKIIDEISSHCFTQYINDVRLDYHGPVQVNLIMEWFYTNSRSVVQHLKFTKVKNMFENVRIIAVIVPSNSRFLPITNKKYYSLECYNAVCNVLFGLVSCYTVYSLEIPHTEYTDHNQRFVSSQIRMERKDGINVDIMKLGQSLYNTIDDESSQLLQYHQPHRYKLRPNQQCEEDHGMCSEFIVSYTKDHLRLPVTHLSSVLLHTNNNLFKDNELPIVVVLVKADYIKTNTTFIQTLNDIGYEYYSKLMIVTLDVDMYSAWAGQFVPIRYKYKQFENTENKMYDYPRICIINWNDHNHGAFYPPFNSQRKNVQFTKTSVTDFLDIYLTNPSLLITETEQF